MKLSTAVNSFQYRENVVLTRNPSLENDQMSQHYEQCLYNAVNLDLSKTLYQQVLRFTSTFMKEYQLWEFSNVKNLITSKAAIPPCSLENMFQKFSNFSQKNIRCRVFLLVQLQLDCSKKLVHSKLTLPPGFSRKLSECFQNYYISQTVNVNNFYWKGIRFACV